MMMIINSFNKIAFAAFRVLPCRGQKKVIIIKETPVKLPDQAIFHPPQEPPQVI
jgi:hypothetical protein